MTTTDRPITDARAGGHTDDPPFPRRLVDRRALAAEAAITPPLPEGTTDVPPRPVVWQGPDRVAFVQGHPERDDPPGTVRWVAIQPDGKRVPSTARLAGEA